MRRFVSSTFLFPNILTEMMSSISIATLHRLVMVLLCCYVIEVRLFPLKRQCYEAGRSCRHSPRSHHNVAHHRHARRSSSRYNQAESSLSPEAMYSVSYDPLEMPTQKTKDRDLEDSLKERAMRFFDNRLVRTEETCYLVGLEDKTSPSGAEIGSNGRFFTMEESLSELSELAGAAGLKVLGSTYQRIYEPNPQYFIGEGKVKEIVRNIDRLKCSCVIFDSELSPSQQKNLELIFNQDKKQQNNKKSPKYVKVIDRTALILDIFAQHAKTKEGQLQVRLALLLYRLPRLTKMWSHLERQTSASKGRSNGGVGLRGPGEKQLESDRREMKTKISLLKREIDSLRNHRSIHREKRRRLGIPIISLVGYTNSGKSSLLNAMTKGGVFAADMLFATLDPTTRM